MDLSTSVLFGAVALLGLDHVVMSNRDFVSNVWIFRLLIAAEVTVGLGLTVFGLPGFEQAPMARWLLVALFAWHVVQNTLRRRNLLGARGEAAE